MTSKKISGVYAAVLTPRRSSDNSIDVPALTRLILFLISKGISSFAINGATGEFSLATVSEVHILLTTVQEASEGKAQILCGVGAPGTALAIELAGIAESKRVMGLLLPMPSFFPYQQEDLDIYCRKVAESTSLPVLLYNLPQFTSGLDKETVYRLISEVSNIVGIKDSSGSLEILRYLTDQGIGSNRIVGSDSALTDALIEGVCDGVISGVACAVPEIIQRLYANRQHTDSALFHRTSQLLTEFIRQIDFFPTPWGLKWIVEARGIIPATFSQPVTGRREEQARRMASWFLEWLPSAVAAELAIR